MRLRPSGRRRGRAGALGLLAALAALGGPVEAQTDPVGVWNIRSRDMTDRATGGVRVVLLRVQEASGGLSAEITSIANRFMPVEEFRYDRGAMRVVLGSYEYDLRVEGDELTGVVVTPLGRQELAGFRQHETLMYVGDEPSEFRTVRPGVIGHRTDLEPPQGEADPARWVLSRVRSADDLALVVGRRAKVAVQFTNARDFEAELRRLAGQPVTVVGVWVGERLRIETIEAGTP